MKERLRDKTRDEITRALNELGIAATMAERGRPEEKIEDGWWNRSQGIIDLPAGPIRWINCLKQDGSQYSPPQWWAVLGIPDERTFSDQQLVKIKTVRKKSIPLFGKVVDVTWQGEDRASRLLSAFANDPVVKAFVKKTGDVEIKSHAGEFQGWTVQISGKFKATQQDWDLALRIAERLLTCPQP